MPTVSFAETDTNLQNEANGTTESVEEQELHNEEAIENAELPVKNDVVEENTQQSDDSGEVIEELNNDGESNNTEENSGLPQQDQPSDDENVEEEQSAVEESVIEEEDTAEEAAQNTEVVNEPQEFDSNYEEETKVGWVEEDGKYFFYDKYGNPQTGIVLVEGKYYYIDEEKGLLTGWIKNEYESDDGISVVWYYADENGILATNGWKKINGKWYYFERYGVMETGLIEVNGKYYYLDNTGAMRTGWIYEKYEDEYVSYSHWYYANSDGSLRQSQWLFDGKDWYYFDDNGVMLSGDSYYVNGNFYYFDSSGRLGKGGWSKSGNYWYYTNKDGTPVTGWKKIGDSWYFFNYYGTMETGLIRDDFGDYYYLDPETGAMKSGGWIYDDDLGYWYYADKSGKLRTKSWLYYGNAWYYFDYWGTMVTEPTEIGDKIYFFDPSGKMVKKSGWLEDQWGYKYYGNGDGTVKRGWAIIDNKSYYFDYYYGYLLDVVDRSNDVIKIGWSRENNTWYYYDSLGNKLYGYQVIDGVPYYFDLHTGAMKTGWIQDKYEDEYDTYITWYYAESDGSLKRSKWFKENGKWYYFWFDGEMATGRAWINDKLYYFNPVSGAMSTGWILEKYWDEEYWSYADSNGELRSEKWLYYGNNWYYFDYDHRMVSNDTYYINGKMYYFDDTGKLASGGWYSNDYGKYYTNKDGTVVTEWQNIGGKWYYFNWWGELATGFVYLEDGIYYLDEKTGEMKTGWIHIKYDDYDEWYYAGSSGKLYTSKWLKYNNKWYYFLDWGEMVTWPIEIGNKLYLFKDSGEMIEHKEGWMEDQDGNLYYSNGDGSFKFGWWRINGEWYYFSDYNGMLWQ